MAMIQSKGSKGGNMDYAVFDIETIPCQSLPEGVKPEFDPDTVKLGNVKDQAKIDEKREKAKQEFEEGLIKKMSLDPDLCEVVCFVVYKSDIDEIRILIDSG